jgi:hypothetical protein
MQGRVAGRPLKRRRMKLGALPVSYVFLGSSGWRKHEKRRDYARNCQNISALEAAKKNGRLRCCRQYLVNFGEGKVVVGLGEVSSSHRQA